MHYSEYALLRSRQFRVMAKTELQNTRIGITAANTHYYRLH